MYYRIIVFLTGFGFMVIGLTYLVSYLNLMTIGYTMEEYINFILSRFECWLSIIGFLLILLSIYIPSIGSDNDELSL